MHKTHKIAVIGLGYVGLPLALLADRKGFSVTGIDSDEEKVRLIKNRMSPFKDNTIAEALQSSSLVVTSDPSSLAEVDSIIICVPTPVHKNHLPNLDPVLRASQSIAKYLTRGQLVVLESTVNPGVTENAVIPILEESGLKAGEDFYVAHCPERINPGDKKWSLDNIPRVVGALEKVGLEKALTLYRSLVAAEIFPMNSLKEAESVKVVENSFRDINIAFVNELAMSFSALGIDVTNVIKGAATKPFAFMPHFPGVGVGGHCIPVDPYYLIEHAKENGFTHDFLILARRINNRMPAFTVSQLVAGFKKIGKPVKGARVALLGLAYKADIDDGRESPSYEVLKQLKSLGMETRVYDPYISADSTVKTIEEALTGADAVLLATAHSDFLKALTPELLAAKGIRLIVDGRNVLPKAEFVKVGIVYSGIGR